MVNKSPILLRLMGLLEQDWTIEPPKSPTKVLVSPPPNNTNDFPGSRIVLSGTIWAGTSPRSSRSKNV